MKILKVNGYIYLVMRNAIAVVQTALPLVILHVIVIMCRFHLFVARII